STDERLGNPRTSNADLTLGRRRVAMGDLAVVRTARPAGTGAVQSVHRSRSWVPHPTPRGELDPGSTTPVRVSEKSREHWSTRVSQPTRRKGHYPPYRGAPCHRRIVRSLCRPLGKHPGHTRNDRHRSPQGYGIRQRVITVRPCHDAECKRRPAGL